MQAMASSASSAAAGATRVCWADLQDFSQELETSVDAPQAPLVMCSQDSYAEPSQEGADDVAKQMEIAV